MIKDKILAFLGSNWGSLRYNSLATCFGFLAVLLLFYQSSLVPQSTHAAKKQTNKCRYYTCWSVFHVPRRPNVGDSTRMKAGFFCPPFLRGIVNPFNYSICEARPRLISSVIISSHNHPIPLMNFRCRVGHTITT